jgi:glycine/D-amino acid oxidase-like deaminating enzyme
MTERSDPDAGAREALRLIGPDPANWVPDREGVDHNVVIVGGGQTGCAFAFALRRAGIGKVAVIDAAPDAERAGIWQSGARMHVLRTPKTLPGPEFGIAALSFQAWYEARHGEAAYGKLGASRVRIGSIIWPGTADFLASRCATAPGSRASSRSTDISGSA